MGNPDENAARCTDHLHDIGDGVGCTEIWEHLSDRRAKNEEEAAEEGERR